MSRRRGLGNASIIAIDPGSTQSGFVQWTGAKNLTPYQTGKIDNSELIKIIGYSVFCSDLVIERVVSYGMPVGKTTFQTVEWIGRFVQRYIDAGGSDNDVYYYTRPEIKVHNCFKTVGVSDSILRQRMIDRYAAGTKNYGKGSKKEPGFFYGFSHDIWQAFVLASTHFDKINNRRPTE